MKRQVAVLHTLRREKEFALSFISRAKLSSQKSSYQAFHPKLDAAKNSFQKEG